MASDRLELLRGTLDLLVLRVLANGAAHGYTIARRILLRSEGVLLVEEGSLYPALHRMERRGWLLSEWGTSQENRRAKFYRLSAAGRRELAARQGDWERMAGAITGVLRPVEGEA